LALQLKIDPSKDSSVLYSTKVALIDMSQISNQDQSQACEASQDQSQISDEIQDQSQSRSAHQDQTTWLLVASSIILSSCFIILKSK